MSEDASIKKSFKIELKFCHTCLMGIDRPLPTSVSMMVSFSFFSFCKSIFVFCFQVASSFLNIVKVVVTMYDLAALKLFFSLT